MTTRAKTPVSRAIDLWSLVDAITDCAIYILDRDGTISSWNAGAERITGYTASDIVGRQFSALFIPEDQASGMPEQVTKAARKNGRHNFEGWHARKDGSRFLGLATIYAVRNAKGRRCGFAVIMRDATDSAAAREVLLESDRQFHLLVQAVVDYAIYTLDPKGFIVTWNAGAQRIKGYATEEIIGKHFSQFYTEEDRQKGEPARALRVAETEGKYEHEGWRIRKDGTRFWAHVVIDPIRNSAGEPVGFAKITRDITERRAAQETIERTRAALAQAQKMEAIGQLTGGIAHDFNNLLTIINNNLDLVFENLDDQARIERLVLAAQTAAERGAKLTQQLLAFGRRQPLRPEIVDINMLIGGIEAVLRRACGDAVSFELDLSPILRRVRLDTPQFEAVLLNLALNARDAMPNGGVLRITTGTAEISSSSGAGLNNLAPGQYILVCVHDTGTGMTPEVQAHAFEPFFTTKEPGKGSGLGLSQVYGFVSQSGGHVTIESEVGKGTSVCIYLPTPADTESATTSETYAKSRYGTVLVVEDDPDVLQSTVEMVRGLGYDVLTAGDGASALAVLKRNVPIDILFSDVVMPKGVNGVELAREARRLRPDLRVLLSSGYATALLTMEHGLTPNFAFIGKPYRWPELAEKLRTAMAAYQ